MTGPEEYAAGRRGIGSFPPEWGMPRGRPDSEERTAWVRSKVKQNAGVQALRQLAAHDIRLLAELRLLDLKRREKGPE